MDKKMTMADLMASVESKQVTFKRGDKVVGKVIVIAKNEVILDLGTKAEGILNKGEFAESELQNLQAGSKVEAFVTSSENESGQINLSLQSVSLNINPKNIVQQKKWQRVINAYDRKNKMSGRVVEANKGGLVVEVDKIRGFLPTSQISLKLLNIQGQEPDLSGLIGQDISVSIIEIDPKDNRLILSTRGNVSEDIQTKLEKFEIGKHVSGKIAAITPVGLMVDLDGVEGVVYQQEVSWEPIEDLNSGFKVGQEIQAQIIGKDLDLGRVNLSIRQLSEDPFDQIIKTYGADGVISGVVSEVNSSGVTLKLPEGLEGIIPLEKIGLLTKYQLGEEVPAFVDGIDKGKRKLNLMPFLTSTKGLIYK